MEIKFPNKTPIGSHSYDPLSYVRLFLDGREEWFHATVTEYNSIRIHVVRDRE